MAGTSQDPCTPSPCYCACLAPAICKGPIFQLLTLRACSAPAKEFVSRHLTYITQAASAFTQQAPYPLVLQSAFSSTHRDSLVPAPVVWVLERSCCSPRSLASHFVQVSSSCTILIPLFIFACNRQLHALL